MPSLTVEVETTVKVVLPGNHGLLTLSKDEAVALRDALNEAFPVVRPNPNHWTTHNQPGIRRTPLLGGNMCGGFGGDVTYTADFLNIPNEIKISTDVETTSLVDQIIDAMKKPLTEEEINTPVLSMGHTYRCKCDGRAIVPGPNGSAVKCDALAMTGVEMEANPLWDDPTAGIPLKSEARNVPGRSGRKKR